MCDRTVSSLIRTQQIDSREPAPLVMMYFPSGVGIMFSGMESTGAGVTARSGVITLPVASGVCSFWQPAAQQIARGASNANANRHRVAVRHECTVGPFP